MSEFELFSKYWATPLSSVLTVVAAIILLYPVILRLTLKQLQAALEAVQIAKSLPATIAQFQDVFGNMRSFNDEITSLKDQLAVLDLDGINEKLARANAGIADVRKLTEDQPDTVAEQASVTSDGALSGGQQKVENWQEVRKLWRDARDTVEEIIASIPDGRTARKYSSATRYQYDTIADYG